MRTSSPAAGRRAGVVALAATLLAGAAVATAPAALADAVCASAPTVTWTGAGDGSWTDAGNWSPAPPSAATSNVVIAPAAPATPGDPVNLSISDVSGTVCSLRLDKSGSPTSVVTVTLHGGLAIGADAVAPNVEVNGATLVLADGTSQLAAGTTVTSSNSDPNAQQPFGTLTIGSGATLQPGGLVSIGGTATLGLANGGTLDATTPSTLAQITIGQGKFAWAGGTVTGSLTDDVLTNLEGAGTRTLAAGATLTNKNAIEVDAGTLAIAGTVVNGGILRLLKDVTVSGAGMLQNGPGVIPTGSTATTAPPALLAVGGPFDVSGDGTATIDGVALHNIDQISVVSGVRLLLTNSTQSWLHNNSSLTSPQPPTTTGPGVVQVGAGETLSLQGTTKLIKGAQLRIDDGAAGSTSTLAADTSVNLPVVVTATATKEGTLAWASGTIAGPLQVDGAYLGVTNGAAGSSSRRLLTTSKTGSTDPAALTLKGSTTAPTTNNGVVPIILPAPSSPMILRQDARVLVQGQFDLAGPGGGIVRQYGTTGQSLTVDTGATLRRRPASSSASTAPAETALVNVPFVNEGTVELDASLDAAGGYKQQIGPHSTSTSARPLTALLAYSTLTSPTTITVTGGGIGGKGTVHAPTLSTVGAWIGAGYRANCREVDSTHTYTESCIGTIHVAGALKLSSTSDIQIVIRKETVNGKSTIQRDTVAVTGAATLAGTLTAATGSGYTPTYLTAVSHVMTFASRSGSFTRILSPLAPVGYGWRPTYDDVSTGGRGVDVHLVDTGPPVIGYAGLPAFSQQNVLEVHYAAHDNQTGVASYDVRWRRAGGTNGTYSAWVAPSGWQHTTATFQVITGLLEGYTYCVQVRARDKAGNVSPWTAAPCTARELDDRYLSASAGWARSSGHSGWYDGTYTRTTAAGATLKRAGTFTRIAVSAYRCPTCGTLAIYSGSTLVKTWNLNSTSTGRVNYVSPVRTSATATVTLKSTVAGRQILVDALGLLR